MSLLSSNFLSPQQTVANPPVVAQINPPSSPTGQQFTLGQIWVNAVANEAFILTGFTNGLPVWTGTGGGGTGNFTSLNVSPGPTAITGEFRVNGNVNEANVIELQANAGAAETILIKSVQGTGAGAIELDAVAGGINIHADAAEGDIAITSSGGSVTIAGQENEANNVFLQSSGGTSATMAIQNTTGTADAAIPSTASISISSTSGGIGVVAGKQFNLEGASGGNIQVTTGGTLSVSNTNGAITIDANGVNGTLELSGNKGSSTDVQINATGPGGGLDINTDIGGVDIDTQGGITFDAVLASNITVAGGDVDLTLQSTNGAVNIFSGQAATDAIELQASNAAGGIDFNAGTGGVDIDTTGAITFDAQTASNITVTGAAADLTLQSVGGSVNMLADEVAADAIVISATGASAGIQIAPAATVATIAIGNITPTVGRTTTVNGGAVTTAVTDLVSIADGGVNTNAGAEKEVTIATGANLLGTTLVNIGTGTAATGTHTVNISSGTGGGTKTVQVGNLDALTTITEFGTVNINTSTSTGATTIGNVTNGGAVGVNSIGVITVNSADTTGADVVIEATGAGGGISIAPTATTAVIAVGNVVPTVSRTTTINGGTVATAVTDTINVGTGATSTNAGAHKTINIGTGNNLLGATAVNIATGTTASGTKSVAVGNVDGLTGITAHGVVGINSSTSTGATTIGNATNGGAVLLAGGTAGNVSVANVQIAGTAGPSATVSATLNARVGSITLAGYTQAAAATLTITLTNSFISAGSVVLASMTDTSTNASAMTLTKINPASGGNSVYVFTNNGSQAVNGNLQFNFWVLS